MFLNNFLIINPLLKFTLKTLKLSQFNFNTIGFILPDLDLFFDAYTRRILPHNKHFWLELNFIFNKSFKLPKNIHLKTYSQLFFCHNIFEI